MPAGRSLLAALLSAALFATACGDGSGDPGQGATSPPASPATTEPIPDPTEEPTPEVLLVEVRDGKVVGGVPKIDVAVGTEVTFRVLSDVADEVHVHGVDHHVDVEPGVEATVTFTADIPGQFEIELEDTGVRIVDLVVR